MTCFEVEYQWRVVDAPAAIEVAPRIALYRRAPKQKVEKSELIRAS